MHYLNKTAIVTGASAGIGKAIVKTLVQNGMKVVGLARSEDKLKELETSLSGQKGTFYPIKADVSQEDSILNAFQWVDKHLGGVHVLINNAAHFVWQRQTDITLDGISSIYNTNTIGLQLCTREGLKSMNSHNILDGYIINISSAVVFHDVVNGWGTYHASKAAADVIAKAIQTELITTKPGLRVTTIYPAFTNTEMSYKASFALKHMGEIVLYPNDLADTVLFLLTRRPNVMISDITIRPAINLPQTIAQVRKQLKSK